MAAYVPPTNPFSPLVQHDLTRGYRQFRQLQQGDTQLADARDRAAAEQRLRAAEEGGRNTRLGTQLDFQGEQARAEAAAKRAALAQAGVEKIQQLVASGDYAAALSLVPGVRRHGADIGVELDGGGKPRIRFGSGSPAAFGGLDAGPPPGPAAPEAPPAEAPPGPSDTNALSTFERALDASPADREPSPSPQPGPAAQPMDPDTLDPAVLEALKNERWAGVSDPLIRAFPGRYQGQAEAISQGAQATNLPLEGRLKFFREQGSQPFAMTRHLEGQSASTRRAAMMSGYKDDSSDLAHRRFVREGVHAAAKSQGLPPVMESLSKSSKIRQQLNSGNRAAQIEGINEIVGMAQNGRISDMDYKLQRHGLKTFVQQLADWGHEKFAGGFNSSGISGPEKKQLLQLVDILHKSDTERAKAIAGRIYSYALELDDPVERDESFAVLGMMVPPELLPHDNLVPSRTAPTRRGNPVGERRSFSESRTVRGPGAAAAGLDLGLDPEAELDAMLESPDAP